MIILINALTPVQEANIHTYLSSMPADIKENIEVCKEKWLKGDTTSGYPHPVHVCANLQALNTREPFLTVQQTIDLQILKSQLNQAMH
jgi:hypothetical protein